MFRTGPALAPANDGGIWDRVEALASCQEARVPRSMGTGLAAPQVSLELGATGLGNPRS